MVGTVNLYYNLFPEDVAIVTRRTGFALVHRSGKWVTVTYRKNGDECVFTAKGTYDYVVRNGTIQLIRLQDISSHTVLAGEGPVEYAGQMKFGCSRGNRGQLLWWDNGSGHFKPRAEDASQATLPLDRFRSHSRS